MSNSADYLHGAQPHQNQLVLRRHPETGKPVEGQLRWGFIPHDAVTRPQIQPIHVRAETIAEKAMFADAYRKRRCVVPMNSFFQKDAHGRRYTISRRDGALFGVAGIWDNWRNPETGEWERTFAVITVEPNEVIAKMHDRMMAILHNEELSRWLSLEDNPRDLLRPFPAELLDVSLAKNRNRSGAAGARLDSKTLF
jgi:putative SOS response-associated peptidase YedK